MKNKFIQNNSGVTIVRLGQVLDHLEVYEIGKDEYKYWVQDEEVKADLKSGDMIIVKNIDGVDPQAPYMGLAEFGTIDEEEDLILICSDGNILIDQNYNVITGADQYG